MKLLILLLSLFWVGCLLDSVPMEKGFGLAVMPAIVILFVGYYQDGSEFKKEIYRQLREIKGRLDVLEIQAGAYKAPQTPDV